MVIFNDPEQCLAPPGISLDVPADHLLVHFPVFVPYYTPKKNICQPSADIFHRIINFQSIHSHFFSILPTHSKNKQEALPLDSASRKLS